MGQNAPRVAGRPANPAENTRAGQRDRANHPLPQRPTAWRRSKAEGGHRYSLKYHPLVVVDEEDGLPFYCVSFLQCEENRIS
jgi:hypothetical protein